MIPQKFGHLAARGPNFKVPMGPICPKMGKAIDIRSVRILIARMHKSLQIMTHDNFKDDHMFSFAVRGLVKELLRNPIKDNSLLSN